MADSGRVNFTKPAAERIAAVVRKVEQGERDQSSLAFSKPLVEPRVTIRICTFTGSWGKDTFKTVTLVHQTSTPNTLVAVNLFSNLSVDCGSRKCAVARDGTAWHLIQAEC